MVESYVVKMSCLSKRPSLVGLVEVGFAEDNRISSKKHWNSTDSVGGGLGKIVGVEELGSAVRMRKVGLMKKE